MTSTPLVSILMPCYNKARFVGEAIRSVLDQTYAHVEVVAVDDGSTDGTWDVIRSFPKRVVALQQRNGGTAAARQLALERASGELIGLLDHDDRWLPHKLERQVPLFVADPSVGLVTAPYYVMGMTGERIREAVWPGPEAFEIHAWKVENRIGSITTMFRRDAARAVGGFDTSIRGCDDWDLWLRIADQYRVAWCDEPLAEYRSYAGQLSRNGMLMYRNRLRVLRKYRGMHPSCAACEASYRAGLAQARAKLCGYADEMRCAGFEAYERCEWREAWYHYRHAVRAWPALLLEPGFVRTLASLAKRSALGGPTKKDTG